MSFSMREVVHTSEDHKRAVVFNGTILSMIAAFLLVMIKFTWKKTFRNIVTREAWNTTDFFMLLAMAFDIAHGVLVCLEVHLGGLARHQSELNSSELILYEKFSYAASAFYLASLCLARHATLDFISRTFTAQKGRSPVAMFRTIEGGAMACNCALSAIFVVVAMLDCGLTHPWVVSTDKCIRWEALWVTVDALGISLDLMVVLVAYWHCYSVQTSSSNKFFLFLAFFARFGLIPLIVLRIIWTPTTNAADRTFDGAWYVFITALHANGSVCVACVPFVVQFFKKLKHGTFTVALGAVRRISMRFSSGRTSALPLPSVGQGNDIALADLAQTRPRADEPRSRLSVLAVEGGEGGEETGGIGEDNADSVVDGSVDGRIQEIREMV